MGTDLETVETSVLHKDPLLMKQKEDVAKMRASLLCCSDDPYSATAAIQNITVLRIYHQVSRIIKYLEMMDKLEDKLYESMEFAIDHMDPANTTTWMMLLSMQEKLQKSMIDSHKLLQPYLDVQELRIVDYIPTTTSTNDASSVIPRESRDKLRSSAQKVLQLIGPQVDEVEVS